jgi:hypothetical protein
MSFKDDPAKLACCNQILIVLSTSDYLLNSVLVSIIENLQIVIDFLCEKASRPDPANEKAELENIANNCIELCNCVDSIVKIRLLDNYTPINTQIRAHLTKFLNSVFINLTDTYPLIAIQLSKLIQLLSLSDKN